MSSNRPRSQELRHSRAIRRSTSSWRGRLARGATGLALVLALTTASATVTWADDHDPEKSGHPVRVIAYILHPVGVILDYMIFRPAHWVVSHEPFQTLFGHVPDE